MVARSSTGEQRLGALPRTLHRRKCRALEVATFHFSHSRQSSQRPQPTHSLWYRRLQRHRYLRPQAFIVKDQAQARLQWVALLVPSLVRLNTADSSCPRHNQLSGLHLCHLQGQQRQVQQRLFQQWSCTSRLFEVRGFSRFGDRIKFRGRVQI